MTHLQAAELLISALREGSAQAFDRLSGALAPDAFIMAPMRPEATGAAAVAESLKEAQQAGAFAAAAAWEGPIEDPRGVRITARTPGVPFPGITWLVEFNRNSLISRILESRLRPAPQPPAPLQLTDSIKQAVNEALDAGTPLVMAYVSPEGKPRLSFRGTAQAYSDDQLAVWARYEDGGLPSAISANPEVSLVYYARGAGNLIFEGRARIDASPGVRDRIFENSPVVEQRADPERNGVAILIDLDRVTGRMAAERVNMARGAQ